MGTKGDDLTSDEPYVPNMSLDDADALMRYSNSRGRQDYDRRMQGRKHIWVRPDSNGGQGDQSSYVGAADTSFLERIAEIEKKLDAGIPLSEAEAEYMVSRTITRILKTSRRPTHVLKAIEMLQQARAKKLVSKMIEAQISEPKEPPPPQLNLP
jgi:hypothetical protein